jgi:tRNA(adenine34) deaminase
MDVEEDERWMRLALEQARIAASLGEVPVGCVIVDEAANLLSAAHNLRETDHDPTAHAEIAAIRAAALKRGAWRLSGATLYVTLEPCAMCAGAMVNARIDRLVFGADDLKAGACGTHFNLGEDARLNHRFTVTRGVLADESRAELRAFFSALRALGKK